MMWEPCQQRLLFSINLDAKAEALSTVDIQLPRPNLRDAQS